MSQIKSDSLWRGTVYVVNNALITTDSGYGAPTKMEVKLRVNTLKSTAKIPKAYLYVLKLKEIYF